MKNLISAYLELTKPRILTLILVTTTLGFFLGGKGISSYEKLFLTLIGAALVCAGASALNQYLERDADAKMERTKARPIPTGVISPNNAMVFGIILILAGITLLAVKINILTAFLSLLTAFLYVLVYTPLKKMSWINTTIGAIPGAIPPMGGWAAATNDVSAGAWVLFLILFIWQHPHFFAIAWMYKDDYRRGGFKMLPVVQPDGRMTFQQIIFFCILLIPVSLLPLLIGMSGPLYGVGAFVLGIYFLTAGVIFYYTKSYSDARQLLKASVIYLPVLLFLIILDVAL